MIKTSVQTATLNQGETYELWTDHNKGADVPGPGKYSEQTSTFGQTHNAPTMGARIEERYNQNPGPGQYDADASRIRSDVAGAVRIGQAERQDLWSEQMQGDKPGPGNYSDQTNTFGKAA